MPKNPKQVAFGDEARASLREGVTKLARAVKATLGPAGRSAVIDRGWGEPLVTRDGSTVAEEIDLANPNENMAAKLVRAAAERTSDQAGDGSTTATVLAESLFLNGLKHVTAGVSPMILARGMRAAATKALETLKELSIPVKTQDQILAIATIASNNDREIGKTLADAIEKVGKDGVITIEEGKGIDTTVDVVEGMEFDRGYLSPHFVTNQDKMICELSNPFILVMEEKITTLTKILPLLERVLETKRPLFIIAEDVEGEVLATLVVNKLKGIVKCAAVKAPAYGDRRKAMLQDLAILTGGRAVFKDLGIEPENLTLKDLGTAKKVRITSETTTIIEGAGKKKDIEAREMEIRKELETTTSEYDREKLQERLAKLVGGVAVIRVGAATESEMKEKKNRFESALSATRAAIEEGILPGGGVALFRAREALQSFRLKNVDENAGASVVTAALGSPIFQLCRNSGVEPATVTRNLRKDKNPRMGYDLVKDEFCDMVKEGIVDATKVVRMALENALSVATLLLTSDTIVSSVPKEEEEDGDHHHHGEDEGMEDF
ncbi:MAG TPA: chaperonin GroEL [Planctomycetota bacterium]|nr:chaperonin GroEL [Planctomycetota bacterium]